MTKIQSRNVKKTQFKGVYSSEFIFQGRMAGIKYYGQKVINHVFWRSKLFDSAIEAARAYDLKLIENGLEPVNILKRK